MHKTELIVSILGLLVFGVLAIISPGSTGWGGSGWPTLCVCGYVACGLLLSHALGLYDDGKQDR